eukprot:SAG31_NODE_812_length_11915_cov_64.697360_14_plen_86_part_00
MQIGPPADSGMRRAQVRRTAAAAIRLLVLAHLLLPCILGLPEQAFLPGAGTRVRGQGSRPPNVGLTKLYMHLFPRSRTSPRPLLR